LKNGFTLIELTTAMGISTIILLAGIIIQRKQIQIRLNESRLNQASSLAREFFDARKKSLRRATDIAI